MGDRPGNKRKTAVAGGKNHLISQQVYLDLLHQQELIISIFQTKISAPTYCLVAHPPSSVRNKLEGTQSRCSSLSTYTNSFLLNIITIPADMKPLPPTRYFPLPPQPKTHTHTPKNTSAFPTNRSNIPLTPYLSPSQSRFDLKQPQLLKAVSSPSNNNNQIPAPTQNAETYPLIRMNHNSKGTIGRECNSIMSPCRRETAKPKINFSYNKEKEKPNDHSHKQTAKEQPQQPRPVLQFQLSKTPPPQTDKQQTLKIYKQVINEYYKPPREQIPQTLSINKQEKERICYFKSSTNTISCLVNDEDAGANKQSKMASTQITQSFTTEGKRSDFQNVPNTLKPHLQSEFKRPNPQNAFSLGNVQLSLLDRLSPQKILKKTIIQNHYDFGGIFKGHPNPTTLPKLATNAEPPHEGSQKWSNLVKGLFHEQSDDADLKKSIHCGPQIRHERFKCDMLNAYAGDMAESIVPYD